MCPDQWQPANWYSQKMILKCSGAILEPKLQSPTLEYAQRPLNFCEIKYEDSSVRNDMCVQTGAQKAIAPSSLPPTKWLQSPIGFLLTAAALSQNGRIAV